MFAVVIVKCIKTFMGGISTVSPKCHHGTLLRQIPLVCGGLYVTHLS